MQTQIENITDISLKNFNTACITNYICKLVGEYRGIEIFAPLLPWTKKIKNKYKHNKWIL
jgi:hypothetical protein